jgi:hypothetical protein
MELHHSSEQEAPQKVTKLLLNKPLVGCFGVDVLLPVEADEATAVYIDRFPHLRNHRWRGSIFHRRGCEFADIRDPLRRIVAHHLGESVRVHIWMRRDRPLDDSWRPDLELGDLPISLSDGRGDTLWNGMNIEPSLPHFSVWHRDVVPSYAETEGKANASFALPDRPFNDEDVRALNQKFTVVVDASQFGGPDAELTFETPFVPHLNEFYGRNFYRDYDAARSQLGHLDRGRSQSSQRSRPNASARVRFAFSTG